MDMIKRIARYFARKKYCQAVIITQADLTIFQEKPTFPMVMGILMIVFSYIIGLPAVFFLTMFAVWTKKPLVGIIGGPLIYAISTVVFVIGIRMAGLKHIKALFAWATRAALEKILGDEIKGIAFLSQEDAVASEVEN
ncbi:MAG: hypothetical protein JW914_07105 [Syntrophaceae bacterium]|nr:hypothetical protein [Syntrophaceae bacterium]